MIAARRMQVSTVQRWLRLSDQELVDIQVADRFLHRDLLPAPPVAAKDAIRSARGVAAIVPLAFLVRGQGELGGPVQGSVGLWVAVA
jgi:hypothetical protein